VRYSLVQRGLIALVLVLAMAVWFSASAVVPALARQWHLSAGAAAWLLAFAAVWGAAVIADSGVFSTLLSELADRRYVGTALTAQTAIGFLLTIVTIQLIPLLAGLIGWRYAFVALAAGPMTALPAMTTLNRRMRRSPHAIPIIAIERTSP
jgi:MFS family permease